MTLENYKMLRKKENLLKLGFSENHYLNFYLPGLHIEVIQSNKYLLHKPFYSLVTLREIKKLIKQNT